MSSEEKLLKDLCKNTEQLVKAINDLTKGVRKITTVLEAVQKLEKQKVRIYHQDDIKITYSGCTNCEHCWDCPDAFTEQAVSCKAYEADTDCSWK